MGVHAIMGTTVVVLSFLAGMTTGINLERGRWTDAIKAFTTKSKPKQK